MSRRSAPPYSVLTPRRLKGVAVASASALGRLHADTAGHAETFASLSERFGEFDQESALLTLRGLDLRVGLRELPTLLAATDLPSVAESHGDLEEVVEELRSPRGFLALSSGDPCPDNERLVDDEVRFFDFEAAAFRHALIDAAHYVIPFPNCWCWARLPDELSHRLLSIHREELRRVCPEAGDDQRYHEALARAAGAWVVWTLLRRLPMAADEPRVRPRILEAIRTFTSLAKEAGTLVTFTDFCERVRTALEVAWPDARAETYPAFGGVGWQLSQ